MLSTTDLGCNDDINGAFDSIALAEVRFTKEGHDSAFAVAARCSESFQRGSRLGVEMAVAVANEIGSHWIFATIWLTRLKEQKQTIQKKIKILHELKKIGDRIIYSNTEDDQWEHILENEKSKYRQAQSVLGLAVTRIIPKSQNFSF